MSKVFETICKETGIRTVYTYQEPQSRGLQSVELFYPKGYMNEAEKLEHENKNLPKSRQKFINPANGKEIGYYRAKNLGIVD